MGHWVLCTECLLALLTSMWAYRKPPGTKDFQCFHWLRPYLNILRHSHTPRMPGQMTVLLSNLEPLKFLFNHFFFSTQFAPCRICHLEPGCDWSGDLLWQGSDSAVARPQGASAAVVSHSVLAWNQCCLCLKKVECPLTFRPNLYGQ